MKAIRLILFLFLGLQPMMGYGQPVHILADTLDWHRYYPLAVGNRWEYGGMDGAPYLNIRTIIADTLAHGRRYFILQDSIPLYQRPPLIYRSYQRYDTSGTVVTVKDVQADTASIPFSLPYEGGDFLAHFDLQTAFGDTLYSDEYRRYHGVEGGYQRSIHISSASVDVAAMKCLIGDFWRACYATDIGMISQGSLYHEFLTYANVDGKEYGTSRVSVATAPPTTLPRTALAVYPNPLRSQGTIQYTLTAPGPIRLQVMNILGQEVVPAIVQNLLPGQHHTFLNTETLASGVYFVRLLTKSGSQQVSVVVLKE